MFGAMTDLQNMQKDADAHTFIENLLTNPGPKLGGFGLATCVNLAS